MSEIVDKIVESVVTEKLVCEAADKFIRWNKNQTASGYRDQIEDELCNIGRLVARELEQQLSHYANAADILIMPPESTDNEKFLLQRNHVQAWKIRELEGQNARLRENWEKLREWFFGLRHVLLSKQDMATFTRAVHDKMKDLEAHD